jgi:hypothetical protein
MTETVRSVQSYALEFPIIPKLCHELRQAQCHAFLLTGTGAPASRTVARRCDANSSLMNIEDVCISVRPCRVACSASVNELTASPA